MKSRLLLLCIVFVTGTLFVNAQSASKYTFSTGTNASLALDMNGNAVDLTTGATNLIVAAAANNTVSAINPIGFQFWEMHQLATTFSVSDNGIVTLNAATTAAQYDFGTTAKLVIVPFGNNMRVGSSGYVRSKLVGVAPNRCLVIEWNNMNITNSTAAGNSTFQARLYETTGVIEFVYGTMTANSSAGGGLYYIGFESDTYVDYGASIATSTQTSSTSVNTGNGLAANTAITPLTSAANGSRRFYRYTSPMIAGSAPAPLSFTNITGSTYTINWTDNTSNETGFPIYYSLDNITYNFLGVATANTTSLDITGMSPSTLYYWKVYAGTEGTSAGFASGSQATLPQKVWVGLGTTGGTITQTDFNTATNWLPAIAPTTGDNLVMTISKFTAASTINIALSANTSVNSFTLTFNGAGSTARTLNLTTGANNFNADVVNVLHYSAGSALHVLNMNITGSTSTFGKLTNTLNGTTTLGVYESFLNISAGATLNVTGNATFLDGPVSNFTSNLNIINNLGTLNFNGPVLANSVNDFGSEIQFNVGNTPAVMTFNSSAIFDNNAAAIGDAIYLGSTALSGNTTGSMVFKGNVTFGPTAFSLANNIHGKTIFDAPVSQTITNNATDIGMIFPSVLVGSSNSPTVTFTGSSNAVISDAAPTPIALTLANTSKLDLGTHTLNVNSAVTSSLVLGTGTTLKLAGASGGQTGSNFPLNYSTLNVDKNSTVEYNGSNAITQTVFATPSYGNLTLTNGSGSGTAAKNISANASVRNTLTFNDNISFTIPASTLFTLTSDATSSARVAQIITPASVNLIYGGSGATKGKFAVERFISARRAWRFLSVPTFSTTAEQTIHDSWQENQPANNNSLAGYGIQITGNSVANGFDLVTSTPAMKTYVPGTNSYTGVPGTLNDFGNNTAYMVFIRGDRTQNSYPGTPTTTRLRTRGALYTGTQPSVSVGTNQFAAVNNPYVSAIDFRNITKTNVDNKYYVYDPQLGTLGGFQTFIKNGSGDYEVVVGGGSYGSGGDVYNDIQSGQGFFVFSTPGGGSISIKEGDKSGNFVSVLKPVGSSTVEHTLRAKFYSLETDGSLTLLDGTLNRYDDTYNNNIDAADAKKSVNFGENLSIRNGDTKLVVEDRRSIFYTDTVSYNLTGLGIKTYQFEFTTTNLQQPALAAFLEDTYLHTSKIVDLNGTTKVMFSVTNDPGSYKADRFRIVFQKLVPTPVTITGIKAKRNTDRSIAISWKIENEINIKSYTIERSADGISFTGILSATARNNNGTTELYNDNDLSPLVADNFYRIKALSNNGAVQYSDIVKVSPVKMIAGIAVYPNPVVDKAIQLQFNKQQPGNYSIQLINKLGQVVYSSGIKLDNADIYKTIQLSNDIQAGSYQLYVLSPDGIKTTQNIIIQ